MSTNWKQIGKTGRNVSDNNNFFKSSFKYW